MKQHTVNEIREEEGEKKVETNDNSGDIWKNLQLKRQMNIRKAVQLQKDCALIRNFDLN